MVSTIGLLFINISNDCINNSIKKTVFTMQKYTKFKTSYKAVVEPIFSHCIFEL